MSFTSAQESAFSAQRLFDAISVLSYETRMQLAKDSACPNEFLEVLAWDEESDIRDAAFAICNLSEESLESIVTQIDASFRITPNKDARYQIGRIVEHSRKLSVATLEIIFEHSDSFQKEAFVQNLLRVVDPAESLHIWLKLAEDESEWVRETTALHTWNVDVLEKLSKDSHAQVVFAANTRIDLLLFSMEKLSSN